MEVGPYDVFFLDELSLTATALAESSLALQARGLATCFFDLFSLKAERSHATCQFLGISAHELELFTFGTATWLQMRTE
jgi:hypothetical protein